MDVVDPASSRGAPAVPAVLLASWNTWPSNKATCFVSSTLASIDFCRNSLFAATRAIESHSPWCAELVAAATVVVTAVVHGRLLALCGPFSVGEAAVAVGRLGRLPDMS